eukprot:1985839-Prymnesium_polylepis.1
MRDSLAATACRSHGIAAASPSATPVIFSRALRRFEKTAPVGEMYLYALHFEDPWQRSATRQPSAAAPGTSAWSI